MTTPAKIKKRLSKIEKTKTATQHALPLITDPLKNFKEAYGAHYDENILTLMTYGKVSELEAKTLHGFLPNIQAKIKPIECKKLVNNFREMLDKNPKMKEKIWLGTLRRYGTNQQINQLLAENHTITEIEALLQDEGGL
jgi:hypothetical protein